MVLSETNQQVKPQNTAFEIILLLSTAGTYFSARENFRFKIPGARF